MRQEVGELIGGFFVVVVPIALIRLWRSRNVTALEAFASLYAVPLTESNTPILERSLRRSRTFRTAGAAIVTIGYVVATGVPSIWTLLGTIAVGLAVGSLADESTRRRSVRHPVTGAILERRSIRTYVERWVLASVAVAVASVVVLTGLLFRLHATAVPEPVMDPVPGRGWITAWALVAVCAVAVGFALLRRLVFLPMPADRADIQAARHALRTAAVLSVLGAMLVIVGYVGLRFGRLATLNDGNLRSSLRWLANLSWIASILAIVIGLPLSLYALTRTPVGPRRTPITTGAPAR